MAALRGARLKLGAEVALAFGAAAAFFLIAAAIPIRGHLVPILLLGGVYVYAVVAVARRLGPLYAVPLAIAGGLAFDSFYIPPTREFGASDWQNWLVVAIYILMGVLIGILAARSARRAESADLARGVLASEQAALRRVATLVAEGVAATRLFEAVAEEAGKLLEVEGARIATYDGEHVVNSAEWSKPGYDPPTFDRVRVDEAPVAAEVRRTGRVVRFDDFERVQGATVFTDQPRVSSLMGAPITVDGDQWGLMIAWSQGAALPDDAAAHLTQFTELVATAISNIEARTETHRLAGEQAALRRVATLVAEAVPPSQLFDAVAAEVGSLLDADLATLFCYEDEDTVKMLSIWTADGVSLDTPESWGVQELGLSKSTAEGNWPGRVDDWTQLSGPLAQFVRDAGVTSSVSSPILVEGRLWGGLAVHSTQEPLPVNTELRVGEFTGLVATAISNVQAREDLAASRARIVAAADDERRQVVRDLHDGAQQRLVHTVVTLQMASQALAHESGEASPLVAEALQHAQEATDELRELAHGILPSVLTDGGLRGGVGALASRMPVPVENAVSVDRLPAAFEATAYFVVAEALTNVAKHSQASYAVVTAHMGNGTLHVQVRDDGVGGANVAGSGLVGLADRVAALDGTFRLESPVDGGTLVAADIPVGRPE